MPGLMTAGPQPAPQPGPQSAPPPGPAGSAPDDEQASNVTPEEQALYEGLVARGIVLLYDSKTKRIRTGILEMLKADPEDPAGCLGEAAGTIMSRVEEAAADGGVPADRDMLMQAGAEIFEQVAEAATAEGVHDFEQDDAAFNKGWLLAVDATRRNAEEAGRLDPEQEQMDFDELAAADKEGRLSEIMGQLGEGGGQAPQQEEPAPPPAGPRGLMGGR